MILPSNFMQLPEIFLDAYMSRCLYAIKERRCDMEQVIEVVDIFAEAETETKDSNCTPINSTDPSMSNGGREAIIAQTSANLI
jgi:hypothetical protein